MKNLWMKELLLSTVIMSVASSVSLAQTPPMAPFGEMKLHHIDSGLQAQPGLQAGEVYTELVVIPDARWVRLYFSEIALEGESYLRFSSLLDGEVQELDAHDAGMWSNTSAYFNGDMVLIELIAAPGTRQNRFVLEQVGVELSTQPISNHCTPPLCGICIQDDRIPSNENWACRLVSNSGGCSAAVYNDNSCVVSAGHCMGNNMVIQFNVPATGGDCQINHPPIEDQFPVTNHIAQNGGVGADWAVMTTGTNLLGQTAYQRYGEFRPIAASTPSSGAIDIWGYGVSETCTASQTQQYSSGEIIDLTNSAVYHTADTTCGNSGSSILQNGEIIGIVSHCTNNCPSSGNIGTRIDLPAFINARDELCNDPVDVMVPADYATIQQAIDAVPSGSTITVAAGTYPEAINFNGKNIVVVSADGADVTTIDATGLGQSVARFSNGETSQAVLDGFTLIGGTGSNVTISGTQYVLGGGIYAAGSSPTIINCIIVGNTAQFGGGVFNNSASPTFENCIFEQNAANPSSGGGAFNFSNSSAQFINSIFIDNTAAANGGGMSNQGSNPTVTDCQFISNSAAGSGGAVRNIQGSAGQFTNSHFRENSAGDVGGAFINDDSGGTTIAASDFCENSPNAIAGNYADGGGNEFLDTCFILGDLNGDGVVDVFDLVMLINEWGPCDDPDKCPADLNGDGVVDVFDLVELINNWG